MLVCRAVRRTWTHYRWLASLCLAGACGAPGSSGKPLLRWGGDAEGGAPFVEADPADPTRVRGFDVEIAALIARELGREPRFTQVAWSSIESSVERGDFDVGLSGVEDSPARASGHSVTVPYYEFREVLAVRAPDRSRFRRLADLAGRRVGTLGGTMAYQMLLEERGRSGLIPVSYDDDVHPYTDLVAGRLDAVLLDHIIAERSLKRSGGFIIQPEPVATGHYVGVLARGNPELRDSVNAILRAAMRDGSLEKVFRAWGVWDSTQVGFFQRLTAPLAPLTSPQTPLPSSPLASPPTPLPSSPLTSPLSPLPTGEGESPRWDKASSPVAESALLAARAGSVRESPLSHRERGRG